MSQKVKCMGVEYKIHEYCDAFPDLEGDELKSLTNSIKQNGLEYPIVRYGGKILDGKNRLRACNAAGVKPDFREWHTTTRDPLEIDKEIYEFVKSVNCDRRHEGQSERAMSAARLFHSFQKNHPEPKPAEANGEAHAEEGKGKSEEKPEPVTLESVAGEMGVSPRLADDASKVVQEGSAALQKAVESGEVAVSDAAKIADLSADKQNAALAKVRAGKAKTVRAAAGKKKKSKIKKIKGNAKLDYDDDVIEEYFAGLKKELDNRNRALKTGGPKEHQACHKHLNNFYDAWKALKKLRK